MKKILAILLVACMAIAVLPVGIWASDAATAVVVASIGEEKYTDLQTAINEAEDGAIIKLLADFALTAQDANPLMKVVYNRGSYCGIYIPDDKNITIDLNGKTVSYVDTYGDCDNVMILNLGNLTINDSSAEKNGKITYKAVAGETEYSYFYSTIFNCGTLTINAGTVENTCETDTDVTNAVDNHSRLSHQYENDCILVVNGGTLIGVEYRAIRQYTHYFEGVQNRVTINNGVVKGGIYMQHGDNWYYPNAADKRLNVDAYLTINGGTITKLDNGYGHIRSRLSNPDNAVWGLEINGGNIEVPVQLYVQRGVYYANGVSGTTVPAEANGTRNAEWLEKHGGFISGGVFTEAPNVEFIAKGYVVVQKADSKYYVIPESENEVKVTFADLNAEQTTTIGGTVGIPVTAPTKDGYVFDGWYLADGTAVTVNTKYYEDTIVTAKWAEIIKNEDSGDIIVGSPEHNVTTEGADLPSNLTKEEKQELEDSANSVNVDESTIQNAVTDNIGDVMDGVETEEDKNYIVKTTIDVELESYKEDEEGNKDLELDITPKYEVYETDSDNDNPNNIPENQEPVKSEVLEVTKPVKIRVDLPAGFAEVGKTIYITHDKGDDEVYIYSGIVKQDSNGLFVEFINPNGFSPFTLTNYVPAGMVTIDNDLYGNLATALKKVEDGDEVVLSGDDDGEYTISREVRFKLNGDFNGKIVAGRGYEVTKREVRGGVEYEVSVYHAPMVPLFFGTTVRVYDADNGTITPNGIPMIIGGMTKTFKFIPDEGYAVADVIVNGESYGAIETLTLDGFSGYITLTAVFEEVSAASDVVEP